MSEPTHEPMDDLLAMTGRAPRGRPDVDALWQRGRWRRRAPMAAGIASGLVLVVGVAVAAPMVAPPPAPVVGPGLDGSADPDPGPPTVHGDDGTDPTDATHTEPAPSSVPDDPSDVPVLTPPILPLEPTERIWPGIEEQDHGADLWDRRFVAVELVRDGEPFTSASPNEPWVEFAREQTRDVARYSGGCNISGGLLVIWIDRLDIDSDGGQTQMGCEPAWHEQDDWFFAFMAADPWWSWDGQFLVLIVGRDRVTLVEDID
jgi:heat shock protein HslJ